MAESPRKLVVSAVLVVALEGFLKALPMQWLRAERRSHGDMLNRALEDTHLIGRTLVRPTMLAAGAATTLLWAAYFLSRIHTVLTAVVLTAGPLGVAAAWHLWRKTRTVWEQHRANADRLWSVVDENVGGLHEIQAFCREETRGELATTASEAHRRSTLSTTLVSAGITATFSLGIPVGIGVVLALGGWYIRNGTLTVGGLAAFMAYGWLLMEPLAGACRQYETLQNGIASGSRVVEVLSMPAASVRVQKGLGMPLDRPASIEFREVSHSYPGSNEPALKKVSFNVGPGETLALAGHNGAGKSTIVMLLAGFCGPTSGEILLGGRPLSSLPVEVIRSANGCGLSGALLVRRVDP